eukprot:2879817-Rhodomonas_salina.5
MVVSPFAVPGTEIAYGAVEDEVMAPSKVRYLPTRVVCDVRYLPTRLLCDVRYWHIVCCCAMYGTEIAYAAIFLRIPYAMPGTDLAYAATRVHRPG